MMETRIGVCKYGFECSVVILKPFQAGPPRPSGSIKARVVDPIHTDTHTGINPTPYKTMSHLTALRNLASFTRALLLSTILACTLWILAGRYLSIDTLELILRFV